MRTNIDIDAALLKRVMKLNPNLRTKKDIVNYALREVIETRKDRSILDLAGADLIDPEYAKAVTNHPVN
jgi:Arc/MetJ family transcription regulator